MLQPTHSIFRDNVPSLSTLGLVPPASCKQIGILDMILEHEVLRRYQDASRVPNVNGIEKAGCLRKHIPQSTEKRVGKVVQWYVVPLKTHTTPSRQTDKQYHVIEIYHVGFVTCKQTSDIYCLRDLEPRMEIRILGPNVHGTLSI